MTSMPASERSLSSARPPSYHSSNEERLKQAAAELPVLHPGGKYQELSMNRFEAQMLALRDTTQKPEKAYLSRMLLHCTMPHSDPGDIPQWRRVNGSKSITIRPYVDPMTGQHQYPFGTLPRLLLYWIVTEAVQTGKRELMLGDRFSDFIRRLGLNPSSGGQRGIPIRLQSQMIRLFRSTVSFDESGRRFKAWRDMQIAPSGVFWWDGDRDGESWIDLGEYFFEAIRESPTPVDYRALSMLKSSTLALDMYGWVVASTFQANRRAQGHPGASFEVPWNDLMIQIGAEYKRVRKFRDNAIEAISRVEAAYPAAQIKVSATGVVVLPALLPIKP